MQKHSMLRVVGIPWQVFITLLFALLLTTAAKPTLAAPNSGMVAPGFSTNGVTVSATIYNVNSSGPAIPVYLASYQAVGDYTGVPPNNASGFPDLLAEQVLYDVSDIVYLKPGEFVTLVVNRPPCEDCQVDAMVGGTRLNPAVAEPLIIMHWTGDPAQYGPYILNGALFGTQDSESCVDVEGRMTGGGSVFTAEGLRVTHGFELRCNKLDDPQRLEINFDKNRFHLESVSRMFCHAVQNADGTTTYHLFGTGLGRLNGVSGAEIAFHFTDGAEPGKGVDIADYRIQDASGQVLFISQSKGYHLLDSGNQQWHPEK